MATENNVAQSAAVMSADKDAPDGDDRDGRDAALRAVQVALLNEIDAAIVKLERARVSESTREHLEILRSLLKAQVTAYLDHFVARRATLYSHTSVMYAGDVGTPGVISTTFRGLLEGGALTAGQATKLAQLVSDRRTLIVFGDRATGKSTLLNSLFDVVSVDDRFVAIEQSPDLPGLKERSFCVRLTVDTNTDIPALFTKAKRMNPGRLVVGEIHSDVVREFMSFLGEDPGIGGMATLRADSVHHAVDAIVAAFGDHATYARQLIAKVKPVFVHMHSDEKGLPRLAAIWSIEGMSDSELVLLEVPTGAPVTSQLVAEA